MRFRLLLIVGLFATLAQAQTPALIDWAAWPNSDGSTSAFSATPDYFAPLAEPTQGGETLITPVCYDNTGANQSIMVSDQQGDTPSLVTTTGTNTDNSKRCDVYLFSNVAAGNNWTKAHLNSGSSNLSTWQMWNVKAYNIAASTPVDKAVCVASAGSASVSVTLPTLSNSGDFVFQFSYASNWSAPNQSGKMTLGSGFSALWDQVGDGSAAQYQVYNSTAGFTATFTQPTSARYISCALALKAGASGRASTLYPRVVAVEADAKPKNIGTTWNAAFTSTTGNVYLSYLSNDAPATSSPITSSPSPNTAWTSSGANGTGTNGHNNNDIYSAKFNSAPNLFSLTITNQGGSSDAIFMLYDIVGGTTTLDGDTGASGGISTLNGTQVVVGPNASGPFTWCTSCLTPTVANDIVLGVYGEAWGTVTGMTAPSGGVNDSCYWLGTSIDGPSQACENNGFFHFIDTGTSAITVTWTLTAGSNTAPNWWAGRLAAYKTSAQSCPAGVPATTCFYIAANGSDSNNGTSEATPWLHSPGMPNCTANCAANTPSGGKGYILRGGDTWHFGNSGASPYTGGTWDVSSWFGTSAATCLYQGNQSGCIYWGVDPTWYTGGSWTRPILTGDNATSTNAVGSCSHQTGASNRLVTIPTNYTILDNFEMTGVCTSRVNGDSNASSDDFVYIVNSGVGGTGMAFLTNLYMHGWTSTASAGTGNNTIACSLFGGAGFNSLQTIDHLVIDGSDSSPGACGWGTFPSFYHFKDSMIRYVTQGVGQWCHDIHDNIFEHIFNPNVPTHGNVLECNDESNGTAVGQPANTPNVWYNNTMRHLDSAFAPAGQVGWWFCPNTTTDYWFNNLQYDTGGFNDGNMWAIAGTLQYPNCTGTGTQKMFNNTLSGVLQPCFESGSSNNQGGFLTVLNEHLINTPFDSSSSGHTTPCVGVADATNINQTWSSSTSQGYTVTGGGTADATTCANDTTPCAPTLGTNATIGTGANHQAYCTTLAGFSSEPAISTDAANACKYGTTDGCTYNSSTHTMSCPAQTAVARPLSIAWDSGAYEFSGALPPAAPIVYSARTDVTPQGYPGTIPCPSSLGCAGGGALNGSNYKFTPSDFPTTPLVRITDESTGGQSAAHSGYTTSCDSSSEVNIWSVNKDRFTICQGGNWQQLWSFNSSTYVATRSTSFVSPGVGTAAFSYLQPYVMYHSHLCPAATAGCTQNDPTIFAYDTTCGSGIATCNPTGTTVVDLATACSISALQANSSASAGNLLASGDDQTFGVAGSSTVGQSSSGDIYVIAWNRTTGCSYWNTATGQTYLNGVLIGTITPTDRFTIHKVELSKGGTYLKVSEGTCNSGCTTNVTETFWQIGTANVTIANSSNSCGHSAIGYSFWVNKCNGSDVNGLYKSAVATPNTQVSLPAAYPSPEDGNAAHVNWSNDNTNDTAPFAIAFEAYPQGFTPVYAWDNELAAQATDGTGRTWRFAHTYVSMINSAAFIPIGLSQDGYFLLWTTDWDGMLGCSNGTSVGCVAFGTDWASTHAYTASSILQPSLGNTGSGGFGYSYQASGSCTSGSTEPSTWNQTLGGTTSDGTCTWTNLGVPRTDVFLAILPISTKSSSTWIIF